MEFSAALTQNMFGFVAALIGGIAGGIFTLQATNKAIRVQSAREMKRDEREIQNLLQALGVEIDTLWSFHMRRIGGLVEALPPGKPLECYYPLTQDYFTIYNANAAMIGRIADAQLRKIIVITYNKCKKVVDGFKYNNELFHNWQRDAGSYDAFAGYAAIIKEDHEELKAYVAQLLGMLAKQNATPV